jgi:cell division protein FtsB
MATYMVPSGKKSSLAKEAFCVLCILIALLVGLFSYLGPWGYREMRRTQAELEVERARVEALRKSNEERMRSVQSLREDKNAIESYARKKGYGRKGEIIQEAPQQQPDQSAPSDTKPPNKGK